MPTMRRAASALKAPSMAKRPRQPTAATRRSAGAVAVTAPKAPSMTNQPLASARRSAGNHSTMALKPAHQGQRHAHTDQRAAEQEPDERVGEGKHQRAGAGEQQKAALKRARPVAVEQDAAGELHGGEHQKIDRGQQPEIGRAQAELRRQIAGDQRVDGAKQIREIVAGREGQQHAHDEA